MSAGPRSEQVFVLDVVVMTFEDADDRVCGLLDAWRRDVESEPLTAGLEVSALRRRWLVGQGVDGGRPTFMAESTPRLIGQRRLIERSTALVSANMDMLLAHLGIPGGTEDEIDQVLAEESRALQGKRGTGRERHARRWVSGGTPGTAGDRVGGWGRLAAPLDREESGRDDAEHGTRGRSGGRSA